MTPPETPKAADLTNRSVYATWTRDTIRYSDLDPNSHVNNGAINMFFEDGRVDFRNQRMAALGEDILRGFAVVKFTATYHALLYFPGEIEVGTVVARIGNSSFNLGQGVFLGDECIATAEVVSVFFDPVTGKSVRLPDTLRDILTGALTSA
ncbi:MAG: acyl-CoA thioesterase [Alphaproteobacteria bacterium]